MSQSTVKIRMVLSISDLRGAFLKGKEYEVDYATASEWVLAGYCIALDNDYLANVHKDMQNAMEEWKKGPEVKAPEAKDAKEDKQVVAEQKDIAQLTTISKGATKKRGCNCSRGKK